MLEKFNSKEALSSENFKLQTLAQLQKDLNSAQCDCAIGSINYIEELAVLLENLSTEKRTQLLYLIDLPENLPTPASHVPYFVQLAEQIIHREALKVFFRQQFSNS